MTLRRRCALSICPCSICDFFSAIMNSLSWRTIAASPVQYCYSSPATYFRSILARAVLEGPSRDPRLAVAATAAALSGRLVRCVHLSVPRASSDQFAHRRLFPLDALITPRSRTWVFPVHHENLVPGVVHGIAEAHVASIFNCVWGFDSSPEAELESQTLGGS